MTDAAARSRVLRLVEGARRLADPRDPLGREARASLPVATGLSPEGVALALAECLETEPTDADVDALLGSVSPAPRAHVLLSANVFVAAHRAIALALAASAEVFVRPSRREPETTRLLAAAAPGLFHVVSELSAAPGDHAFLYGADETLAVVRAQLPAGVSVHAHGSGLGLVVVDGAAVRTEDERRRVAAAVARDVVPFDQRGCASPRVVFLLGGEEDARAFASALAAALERAETRVPVGALDDAERAEARAYRDTIRYAAELFVAGQGSVGVDVNGGVVVAPVGRNVHVTAHPHLDAQVSRLEPLVVSVSVEGDAALVASVRGAFPRARLATVGHMQRPPFDGPLDLRG